MVTLEDPRTLALSLPETTERASWGTPGFRVRERLFARLREEGDVLVVWCSDLGEREALVRSEPEKFFTTPHYEGHASVLVRMSAVDRQELWELLAEAWLARAPKRLAAQHEGRLQPPALDCDCGLPTSRAGGPFHAMGGA